MNLPQKKRQLALKKDMLTSNIDAWHTKHMMKHEEIGPN